MSPPTTRPAGWDWNTPTGASIGWGWFGRLPRTSAGRYRTTPACIAASRRVGNVIGSTLKAVSKARSNTSIRTGSVAPIRRVDAVRAAAGADLRYRHAVVAGPTRGDHDRQRLLLTG